MKEKEDRRKKKGKKGKDPAQDDDNKTLDMSR